MLICAVLALAIWGTVLSVRSFCRTTRVGYLEFVVVVLWALFTFLITGDLQ